MISVIQAFLSNQMPWKISGMDFADRYLFIPFFVLLASPFPLSLYLNYKQKQSTSQPSIDNAN
jgi:hypothetical protein